MTTLIMIGLVAFGLMAYRQLPVSDLPAVDFPTISVTANLPGASPDTMASSVATPLERQFSTIAGIDSMISSSGLGSTNITIQFALDRNIDDAALDVQSAISKAARGLPADMPTPPSFRKVNPADSPIMILSLKSDTLPMYEVNEYGETFLAQRLSLIQGVIPDRILGRVNANLEVFSHGIAYPLGALLAAGLAGVIGVRGGIFIGWAGMALSILLLVFSAIPRIRKASDVAAIEGA